MKRFEKNHASLEVNPKSTNPRSKVKWLDPKESPFSRTQWSFQGLENLFTVLTYYENSLFWWMVVFSTTGPPSLLYPPQSLSAFFPMNLCGQRLPPLAEVSAERGEESFSLYIYFLFCLSDVVSLFGIPLP